MKYGYIYDVFLSDKRYDKELIKIENSLTDYGVKGSIIRLSLVNNIRHAIQDMIQKGVKTIVAVGSDHLFSKMMDHADLLEGKTVGLIPLGEHHLLADLFDIPQGNFACPILAARKVQNISLGKINNAYFIHSVMIRDPKAKAIIDQQFAVSATTTESVISIYNLHEGKRLQPFADQLSTMVSPVVKESLFKKSRPMDPTIIHSHQVILQEPKNHQIIVDGQKIMKTPAVIEVAARTVQVIVGKECKV